VNNKAIETLEFHKIRNQLMGYASSSLGKEMVEQLTPSTDYQEVIKRQEETDEAATVIRVKGHVPLGGIFNILPAIKRAEIGGMLHVDEFVQIASTIRASRQLKNFLEDVTDEEDLPILKQYYENMNPPADLERRINAAINENGEVIDSASEKLRSLRTQIRSFEGRVREKLEGIIRSSSAQKMLSDAIITIRNDRFVIPVKQEYRTHFGGMVHDQSASGQTLFIEPQSVIQLNNELHQARMKEQIEIERILMELSKETAVYGEELKILVSQIRELDFMFAKAKYGADMKATKPMMNNRGVVRLFKARHPFIPKNEVVAMILN